MVKDQAYIPIALADGCHSAGTDERMELLGNSRSIWSVSDAQEPVRGGFTRWMRDRSGNAGESLSSYTFTSFELSHLNLASSLLSQSFIVILLAIQPSISSSLNTPSSRKSFPPPPSETHHSFLNTQSWSFLLGTDQ